MLNCGDSMINLHMLSQIPSSLSEETTFGACDGSKNFNKLFSVSCEDFVVHG